jgi:ribosomal protein S6E (S10)
VSVEPGDSVLGALEVMLQESVDHLPVTDGGRLVGICTRSDVLSARRQQFLLEQAQPGWRPPWWRERRNGAEGGAVTVRSGDGRDPRA